MVSKQLMGWGAVVLAVVITLTQAFGWPSSLHYFWAALALIWGIITLMQK